MKKRTEQPANDLTIDFLSIVDEGPDNPSETDLSPTLTGFVARKGLPHMAPTFLRVLHLDYTHAMAFLTGKDRADALRACEVYVAVNLRNLN